MDAGLWLGIASDELGATEQTNTVVQLQGQWRYWGQSGAFGFFTVLIYCSWLMEMSQWP